MEIKTSTNLNESQLISNYKVVHFKVKISYRRENILKFLSHLDMVRTFYRVIRRTDLPMLYTQGYSPRPYISFSPATKVGALSEDEFIIIRLTKKLSEDYILKCMEKKLPHQIKIKEVNYL